jgi:serine/threonine-protein kinase
VAAYLIFGRGGGEPVTVPDVVGMTQPEAEAALEKVGLEAEIDVEDVPKKEAGEVTGQSEDAGATVDTGDTITLTVASGSVSLPMEDLIGATYGEAKAILADLGLDARRVSKESKADPNTVIDVGESSSRVEVGSTVDLVVAIKPKAAPTPTPTATVTPTPTPSSSPKPTPTPTKTSPPPPCEDDPETPEDECEE